MPGRGLAWPVGSQAGAKAAALVIARSLGSHERPTA
jgi:hypothetical protein